VQYSTVRHGTGTRHTPQAHRVRTTHSSLVKAAFHCVLMCWLQNNDFWSVDYNSCKDDMWVAASGMNKEQNFNVTTNPGFVGGGTGVLPNIDNFGLVKKSRIYQLYPGFKSCPRSSVGPRRSSGGPRRVSTTGIGM